MTWSMRQFWRQGLLACSLLGAWLAVALSAAGAVTVDTVRCEYLENPLGIDTQQPRLSWILESKDRGQSAQW